MSESHASGRNLGLDLLKLIACLAVIGLHIYVKEPGLASRFLYMLCTIGVPLFFMCSGYLLLDRQHFPAKYLGRKLGKIALIICVWCIAATIVKAAGSMLANDTFDETPLYAVFHVFLLGLKNQGVMFVLWYLASLFLIYLMLPAASRLLKGKDGTTSTSRMLFFWGGLAVLIVLSRIWSLTHGRMLQNRVWLTFRLWTYWQFLLLGALLKRAQPFIEKQLTLPLHLVLTILISIAAAGEFVWIKAAVIHNAWASTAYDSLAMIVWTALLFTLVLRFRLSARASGVIQRLVPLTMGVYLIHPILMGVVDALVHPSGFISNLLYYLFLTAGSFLAAALIRLLPFGKTLTTL